jgi:putative membrane protein
LPCICTLDVIAHHKVLIVKKNNNRSGSASPPANLPEPGAEMGKVQQAGLARLGKLNGTAFDAAYIRAQRIAHEQLIRFAEGYIHRGSDQALKQFALQVLPELKEHLKLAEGLRSPRSFARR